MGIRGYNKIEIGTMPVKTGTSSDLRVIVCIFLLLSIVSTNLFSQKDLTLWYKTPATVWTEALPVGNGRLGAMVFGGVEQELVQLNESTLWSGGSHKK